MFDNDDPFLGRVREIALGLPGAAEKVSHGRPAFFTTKVFAYYGGSVKGQDGWIQHGHAVLVLCDPDDRLALAEEERGWVPAYLGASGWLGIDLDERTNWREIVELLDASFRLTAPRRNVDALDALDALDAGR